MDTIPAYLDWPVRQLRWVGLADYKVRLKLPPQFSLITTGNEAQWLSEWTSTQFWGLRFKDFGLREISFSWLRFGLYLVGYGGHCSLGVSQLFP